jgi:hypothetical protein
VAITPLDHHTYLVELTVRAPGVCSTVCVEQVGQPDGTFRNEPCPHGS